MFGHGHRQWQLVTSDHSLVAGVGIPGEFGGFPFLEANLLVTSSIQSVPVTCYQSPWGLTVAAAPFVEDWLVILAAATCVDWCDSSWEYLGILN